MGVREKWRQSWTYVKKMQFFLIMIILAVTVAAIVVSILSSVLFLTKQNEQYVSEQLSAMTAEYDSIIEQYKAVAPFDDPDGKPVRLDSDYLGQPRGERPAVGPFEGMTAGKNRIRVWGV